MSWRALLPLLCLLHAWKVADSPTHPPARLAVEFCQAVDLGDAPCTCRHTHVPTRTPTCSPAHPPTHPPVRLSTQLCQGGHVRVLPRMHTHTFTHAPTHLPASP